MKIGEFDLNKEILIVAEIGNNHEGNYNLAEEMVIAAAEAGVNAVKFQTFRTEHYVCKKDKDRFNKLKSFELTYDQFARLNALAKKNGLIFLSTPFDIESAKFLNTIVPAFKISSGDNTFYPLMETIAQFGKPIIMSSGLLDFNQLHYSKSFIENIWDNNNIQQDIAILHCVTSYPASMKETNLSAISFLKKQLNCIIGYSDHTIGIETASLSVALGAKIVEKHFTLDTQLSDFRDHQLSSDPQEMSELVKAIKRIQLLMGVEQKIIQLSEQESISAVRRSIAASRDLSAGTIIQHDDITWVRPGNGFLPGNESQVLGKTLSKPVCAGDIITEEFM